VLLNVFAILLLLSGVVKRLPFIELLPSAIERWLQILNAASNSSKIMLRIFVARRRHELFDTSNLLLKLG